MNNNELILKNLYKDHFRMGVSVERISERFTNHEIGNPDKESLIKKHFNSMTFGNELKPAYNMGWQSPDATEENLPFVINPSAKAMLDWAKENDMPVRGHVMVWHSQCPKEAFCKGYEPVTFPTDPEVLKERPMMKFFEKLNPVCYVDRDTMLKRLESYIFSLVDYMYANGYGKIIYAWDVVNEAIELEDKTPTGLRNSYWYQVIGDDFIYWSFKFAHDAVCQCSEKYASCYGGIVKPKLFYNDYNEMHPEKKAAIIAALKREGHGHGSVISEALIDGIGMQGHVSDNNNIDQIIDALMEYSGYVDEVHITELDVKCTCTNINAEYYQAVFYKNLFERLIQANKNGAKLTSVTFWGLTDDNSWIRGANPLLFHGDLSEKKSFDALVYAITGEDLGEPLPIHYDLSERAIDFNVEEGTKPESLGFKMIGFGEIEIQNRVVRSGSYALANEKRFGSWSFIGYDLSDFIGQTVEIRAWVQSPALKVSLKADGIDEPICCVDTKAGDWSELKTSFKVPGDVHSMFIRFETTETLADTFSAVYVDELNVKLIGQFESFEDKTNIARIRGVGHLPFLAVTDKDSHEGSGHSLSVTRQEKDATVKFDISPYIGNTVTVKAFVKTADSEIRIGLDGTTSIEWNRVASIPGEWTEMSATAEIPKSLTAAEFYLETDGNGEMLIDDISVRM